MISILNAIKNGFNQAQAAISSVAFETPLSAFATANCREQDMAADAARAGPAMSKVFVQRVERRIQRCLKVREGEEGQVDDDSARRTQTIRCNNGLDLFALMRTMWIDGDANLNSKLDYSR